MASDLRGTWNDVALRWDDWGPPLRPCAEDLRILGRTLRRWRGGGSVPASVFLCGVTPEIAGMAWPFPIRLTAMDQAESMVRVVWPGDLEGVRRALVGNWLESGLADGSQDVIVGDGGFGFFDYPDRQRALMTEMRRLLRPDGLFVYRHYAQAERIEPLDDVLAAAGAGEISNFHVFKWRLAMALQSSSREGVRQQDIWEAWAASGIRPDELPQPGWSARAVGTIELYRGKQARLYFPALSEFRALLEERYRGVEVEYPTYELGARCPFLTARPGP